MTRRRVVIDTDPGLDDAVAILHALNCGRFDVLGLTTVAGNIGLDVVTRNAGRLLALMARGDIPVLAGASEPLVRKGIDEAGIHGDDGLGGITLPEPGAPPVEDAVGWLADLLSRREPGTVDILALGPLTNVATLVSLHPAEASRIGRIVVMGGAIDEKGNVGPRSEFNLACDPEAADIVLRAGLGLTLVPLDVTRRVRAGRDYVAGLRASGSPAGTTAAGLIEAYFQNATGRESRPLHDPCVMLLALAPELFRIETHHLSVDLGNGPDAGALVGEGDTVAVKVAMGIDADAALALLAEGLV
jgi:purine nucleosidase/pyrimidine-specific ribonucleoside hydrolase